MQSVARGLCRAVGRTAGSSGCIATAAGSGRFITSSPATTTRATLCATRAAAAAAASSRAASTAADAVVAWYGADGAKLQQPGQEQYVLPQQAAAALSCAACSGGEVVLSFDDGSTAQYHGIWLRDNCQCPECLDPQTCQRMLDTSSIPLDVAAEAVDIADNGSGDLRIRWSNDGHVSTYSADWLRKHAYNVNGEDVVPSSPKLGAVTKLWDASTLDASQWAAAPCLDEADGSTGQSKLAWADYDEVLATERGVHQWLAQFQRYGMGFVKNAPATMEATEAVARRIAYVRETFYGSMWAATIDPEGTDTAYSNIELLLHTDGNYMQDTPGVQIFHSLVPDAEGGGQTMLLDGFAVAHHLALHEPETFNFFANLPVDFQFTSDDNVLLATHKVFEHSVDGELSAVHFNNYDRAVDVRGTHDIMGFYKHWNTLQSAMYDRKFRLEIVLQPGTIIAIDNKRVLHGRGGFSAKSARSIGGCYISYEDTASRLQLLNASQANPFAAT